MTQRLVIIGAGGFGREVLDIIEAINGRHTATGATVFEVLGFLDDGVPSERLLDAYAARHLGPVDQLSSLPGDVGYVIGVGDPAVRRRLDEQGQGRTCPVLVHPTATIARAVELNAGTIVCAGVRITNHVRIGRHVHLNLNSTVGHDAVLGDYVTVSPLVAVSGNVHVEDAVFLGTGVTVNPGVRLGEGCVVGSGAAVLRDVQPRVTAIGVPAKPR